MNKTEQYIKEILLTDKKYEEIKIQVEKMVSDLIYCTDGEIKEPYQLALNLIRNGWKKK